MPRSREKESVDDLGDRKLTAVSTWRSWLALVWMIGFGWQSCYGRRAAWGGILAARVKTVSGRPTPLESQGR